MKKTFIAVACAFAIAFGMTSCDENAINDLVDDIVEDLDNSFGSVDLQVSGALGDSPYATMDSLKLSSCANGVVTDSVDLGDLDDSIPHFQGVNTFIMGADISLSDSVIDISNAFPILGIKTADTMPGHHYIHNPFQDTNLLLGGFNFGQLITQGSSENLFGIAVSDTTWYVGYEGDLNITAYPEPGGEMKAKVSNVKAYYVTESKLNEIGDIVRVIEAAEPYQYLADMTDEERAMEMSTWTEEEIENVQNILDDAEAAGDQLQAIFDNPGLHFSSITFNGDLKSRRTDVQGFVNQLNIEE